MFLRTADGDIGAKAGIALGNSIISNHDQWQGKWDSLDPDKNGVRVIVPAASAAVIRMSR
jgi:hypothetical protein